MLNLCKFDEGFIDWADETSIPLERPFEFKDFGMRMCCFQRVEEKKTIRRISP